MSTNQIFVPPMLTEAHLRYLDALRESGRTNMLGACPYLQRAFRDLSRIEAIDILSYWMETFAVRHSAAAE